MGFSIIKGIFAAAIMRRRGEGPQVFPLQTKAKNKTKKPKLYTTRFRSLTHRPLTVDGVEVTLAR